MPYHAIPVFPSYLWVYESFHQYTPTEGGVDMRLLVEEHHAAVLQESITKAAPQGLRNLATS